jgi:hypothetical protein
MIPESSPRVILTWKPDIAVSDEEAPGRPIREVHGGGLSVTQIAYSHTFTPESLRQAQIDPAFGRHLIKRVAATVATDMRDHLEAQITLAFREALGLRDVVLS